MRILCVGDVCGSIGCKFAARVLPRLRRSENIDITVINGENSADGNGITPFSARALFSAGADVITGGNHTLRRKEIYPLLDENPRLLRPHNLKSQYGGGYCLVDAGRALIAVLNLSGQAFMKEEAENPFLAADLLIERAKNDGARIILVDFHAEATGEKRALGFYLDGRVSAVFGTHTHIPTADLQRLPCGTEYITDIGMTGPEQSVLGVKKEIIIDRMKNGGTERFVLDNGPCILCGCIFDTDCRTGKTAVSKQIIIREEEL